MFFICAAQYGSHMWLLISWNMASATQELNFKILFNFNLFKFTKPHVASGYGIGQQNFRVWLTNKKKVNDYR